ncbi:MAG: hypothetical protein ABFS42_13590 [Candidatus Krumholzibacteriota bacterium]
MISLTALWLPIVLSSVAVFFVSFIIHMVLKYHNNDYGQVPSEDGVMDALRPFDIPPGDYVLPRAADMKAMGSDEFKAKQDKGPVAIMTVLPNGQWSMAKSLVQWFVYCLVTGVLVAYITRMTIAPGADYLLVHRVAGATAFCCYSMAHLSNSIWYMKKWSGTLKNMFDGLVYGLVTGGVFGWLWPGV